MKSLVPLFGYRRFEFIDAHPAHSRGVLGLAADELSRGHARKHDNVKA